MKRDMTGPLPAWHREAKCASHGVDPHEYDLSTAGNPQERGTQDIVRAARACLDCPVIHECAAEAVADHSVGVIRGGQPCPPTHWSGKPDRRQRALEAVARGDHPLGVAAHSAAAVEYLWPAVEHLAALVHPDDPPAPTAAVGGHRG